MNEDHLKQWAGSVINASLDMIGELPSVPVITDEFDQCLGQIESQFKRALTLVNSRRAFNEDKDDED